MFYQHVYVIGLYICPVRHKWLIQYNYSTQLYCIHQTYTNCSSYVSFGFVSFVQYFKLEWQWEEKIVKSVLQYNKNKHPFANFLFMAFFEQKENDNNDNLCKILVDLYNALALTMMS